MSSMIEYLLSLAWSNPVEIKPGLVQREAQPDAKFWELWRSQKQALKDLGIKAQPGANSSWVILWSADPSVFSQVVPQTVIEPESGDFTPEPLDPSVAWSDEQLAIFDWFRNGRGNLVVQARAGTGKTTTIKVAFSQAPEARMLYAVFNKKNQREAEEKISDSRVEVKTLHALGFAFIKRVWQNAKPDGYVERDRIESIFSKNLPDEVRFAIEKLVGFAKNSFIAPTAENLVDICEQREIDAAGFENPMDGGWTIQKLSDAALKVLALSKERDLQGRISFNDMVWLPVANNWVRPWYDLVCIDEAQDMNMPQLQMAKLACKRGSGRICVVGDNRQAIYGFRGAVSDGMEIMREELNAKVLGLTITYRCPKNVVALACEYVPDYKAADAAPEGIVDDVASDNLFQVVKIGDAILSRANAPLMPLCLGLLRRGVSARIEGRDIGKMLLEIIKKLKARSVPDFIGRANAYGERQKARASRGKNSEARCNQIDDQVATLVALAEGVSSVKEIEARCIDLFKDSDDSPKPAVVLSSVHKAKGLEWNRVFLVSETFSCKGHEEENIYYVAVTRAKHHLSFLRN